MLFGTAAFVFAAPNGDVTGDGSVTVDDAREILRIAVKLQPAAAASQNTADLDFDGTVTVDDARLTLRAAVKLEEINPAYCENEYEALRSGHFYTEMYEKTDQGNVRTVFAFTKDKSYVCIKDFDIASLLGADMAELGISASGKKANLALYTDGKTCIMADENTKSYHDFSKDEDPEFAEMTDMFEDSSLSKSLSDFLPLSEATSSEEQTFEGKKCTVYTFDCINYKTEVFMNGRKLLCIKNIYKNFEETMIFEKVSVCVPSDCLSVPGSFDEEDDPMSFMMNMFLSLFDTGDLDI